MDRRRLAGITVAVILEWLGRVYAYAGKMSTVHRCLTVFNTLEKSKRHENIENGTYR